MVEAERKMVYLLALELAGGCQTTYGLSIGRGSELQFGSP